MAWPLVAWGGRLTMLALFAGVSAPAAIACGVIGMLLATAIWYAVPNVCC